MFVGTSENTKTEPFATSGLVLARPDRHLPSIDIMNVGGGASLGDLTKNDNCAQGSQSLSRR
jgi:hypothetical protein